MSWLYHCSGDDSAVLDSLHVVTKATIQRSLHPQSYDDVKSHFIEQATEKRSARELNFEMLRFAPPKVMPIF